MTRPWASLALVMGVVLAGPSPAAGQTSGKVTVQGLGTITASHAVAYRVRDQNDARTTRTEILLTDVAVDPAPLQAALDPHMVAINLDALNDRNYVLLWVAGDGRVSMNATFSKTMTQFLNDTAGGLNVAWTTNSPSRLDGRLFSSAPLKTMDGTTYTVDLKFAVDVPRIPAFTPLPAGGGDPGKALTALLSAAQARNWTAIRAASSPTALKIFDKSYNTPAENAESAADLLKAWIPGQKMKITGGQLRGDTAILEVEGEIFAGTPGLSLVQMVKTGAVWQFESAARAGMIKSR